MTAMRSGICVMAGLDPAIYPQAITRPAPGFPDRPAQMTGSPPALAEACADWTGTVLPDAIACRMDRI